MQQQEPVETCPRSGVRGQAGALVGPIVLLLLTIGFFWKLTLTDEFVWFSHPDMAYLEIPRLEFQAREMHHRHFPLWDPRLWAGQPLIGQTQPGPLYPLNLLFCMLPLDNYQLRFGSLNWYWAMLHYLGALFCYWLARDLGASRVAAILAGCAFGFGGFVGTVRWLDVVNGAIWTPLIVLFQLRALRGEKRLASAALCGLFWGITWLSGHHEIPLLVSAVVVLTWIWYMRRERALLRAAALSLAVAGLVGAVQIWPTYEFGRISVRWVGVDHPVGWKDKIPYASPATYSMPAGALLGTVLPHQGREADASPFLGVVAMSAAALGLAACWRDARVRWLAAMAAVAVVYAMGAFTPLHGVVFSLVPVLNKARIPVRAIHVFDFAMVVLASFGFDVLLAQRESLWVRRVAIGAAAFGAVLIGAAAAASAGGWSRPDDGAFLAGVTAVVMAALWLSWRGGHLGRAALVCGTGALLIFELYGVATATFADRYNKDQIKIANSLVEFRDIADFLLNQPGPVRALVNDEDVPVNFGDWYGIDMIYGYVAGVSENTARQPFHSEPTQRLFSITHRIAKKPELPGEVEVFRGASGVAVFTEPSPMPRARVVHQAVRVPDWDSALRTIGDPGFDMARKAVLLGEPPRLETCDGDTVKIDRHDTDRVTVSARLACRGMLVLSETMFPGWRAYVDGRSAPIHEVYGSMRGVVLDAGTHRVEFRYRPISVYGGAALTFAGLVLVALFVRRDHALGSSGLERA